MNELADFRTDWVIGLQDEQNLIGLLKSKHFEVLPADSHSHDFKLFHVTLNKWATVDLKVQRHPNANIIVETHTFSCDNSGLQTSELKPSGILKYSFDILLTWHKPTNKLYFMSRAELLGWLESQTPEQLAHRKRITKINVGPNGSLFRAVVYRIELHEMVKLSFAICDLNDPAWDQSLGCFRRTP